MKKLSQRLKNNSISLREIKKHSKKLRRKRKLQSKKDGASKIKIRKAPILAPRVFRFIHPEQQKELLSFLQNIRANLMSGARVTIDFSKTEKLHPCGTLIFMANMDTWIDNYKGFKQLR